MMLYMVEPGMNLRKSGGKLVVEHKKTVVETYPIETIESVILSTKCQITSQCLESLSHSGTEISWISGEGKLEGSFHHPNKMNIFRERQQFRLLEDERFCLELSKRIVKGKVHNQKVILQRANKNLRDDSLKDLLNQMSNYMKKIDGARNKTTLAGVEGHLAKMYFQGMRRLLPEEFYFEKRTKHPPKDPVSAILGFLYHLLFHEVYMAIYHSGCNMYIGVMHELRQGHPALVSDLMEEWRAILSDAPMLHLLNQKVVGIEDFDYLEDGRVYLSGQARKRVLAFFEHKIQSPYTKKSHNGVKNNYRTAIKTQVYRFVHAIEEADPFLYEAFNIR